ncbi:uroporphyrinogen-III C-methyltransferase [Nitratireductor mangrovi]|uniref:Uroporphyrinogen-III C-methyltransferase n=1 Tax=Nitratireductor mangrovi TaxID=2599600 RepID=A0A5B8KVV9_9HYPH|nr:siroheme synthase CysG [Nitratireductor mangrovi]QDY99690.1 uroporphyrinogen-III C-methyltransferase [Nitratireductor mangrovi]
MKTVFRRPSEAAPPRVAPLAVLPVFFDLTGKTAIVAGGSDAAAWKAELLVAAGASVEIVARESALGKEMRRLLAEHGDAMRHADADWRSRPLAGAAMAVADAESDEEARAFAAAARGAGVPWNVIDRPQHCGFQFGSIVNRSPVVVGISTAGAAPVLGQAVRRRIETLLPASLAAWASFARRMRDRVNTLRAPGPGRRAFWETLVDNAFGEPPAQDDAATLRHLIARSGGSAATGHVSFVGAGPGDAEHLTLKAVRALQAADVILFDDLVSDEVLELARREAKRILVGKRAGRPSCRQHEINDMMVKLARAGRRVVRLKSGDPMIFGRAGEEIAVLEQERIGYDVVPGISAGAALAATLGVSLTHRDAARSVRFVTGHSKNGGLPDDIDLAAIAHPAATTIVYMGARTAGELVARLIARGMPMATPCAIGASLGRPDQQVTLSTLANLEGDVAALASGQPIVIGIGRIFASASAAAHQPAPSTLQAAAG